MPDTVFPLFRAWGVALAIVTGSGAAVVVGQTAASRFALATVADPKGKAVVDISADDFVVEEAGAGREILEVRIADYPIVLVLDNGGAARADFEAVRLAATRFIERMGPRPIAIITTAPAPALIATFEEEREALLERIAAIEAPGPDDGQPLRATALAATTVRETGALFSAIVVATASSVEVSGTAAEEFVTSIVDSHAV